nr:hypothetical protein CFP56_25777 [Quercus suber]
MSHGRRPEKRHRNPAGVGRNTFEGRRGEGGVQSDEKYTLRWTLDPTVENKCIIIIPILSADSFCGL